MVLQRAQVTDGGSGDEGIGGTADAKIGGQLGDGVIEYNISTGHGAILSYEHVTTGATFLPRMSR